MVMDVIWRQHCVSINCSELGKGATSEMGKYLFRAASVWWRCAHYFLFPLVARCPKTIAVCILCMFVFISVVVTVWGLWEWLLCSNRC